MNRVLLSLLALAHVTFAAERPKGFAGINWGASPEEAKRAMQARPGVKFPEDADDYKFTLTGGTFAGKPVETWILEFPERKFASATVVMKGEGDASILYKEFRTQLVDKYGSATTDKKIKAGGNKQAYPPGTRAPSMGTQTIWKFVPNLKDKSSVTLTCELAGAGDQAKLALKYVNETLTGAAAANAAAGAKGVGPAGVKKDEL